MRRSLRAAAVALVALTAVTGFAACGDDGEAGASGTAPSALKVAMVLPGAINDKGFNQTGYDGLKACEADGASVAFSEKTAVPDFTKTFESFARDNDVVIGHGFEFGEIAAEVADDFPDVTFAVTSNPLTPEASNVVHLMPNSTQGAFLAGVAAASSSKTGKLGGIAGFDFPVLQAQMKAFEAGAKYVDPAVTVKVVYLGTFDDVSKGREAAQGMAASGIDVIYHIADAAGVGIINGAKASKIKVVGWGIDQNSLAPDTVIASQIVDQAKMIQKFCAEAAAGPVEGGRVITDGLQSGVIDLTKVYNEPAAVQAKVDEVREAIIAGDVEVPSIGGDIPGSGPDAG